MGNEGGLIQVPNIIIENTNVKPSTTYLYLMMKIKAQRQNDNTYKLNMYSDNFLKYIDWTQPTFKTHLNILHNLGVVYEYKLQKFKPMNIYIQDIMKHTEKYTQIDTLTVNKILDTTKSIDVNGEIENYIDQAIRLYYYYEHRYAIECQYAYPTFKRIAEECKISKSTISILNEHFKKQKILKIVHGTKWFIDEETGRPRKENNRYIPLCNGRIF